MEQFNLETYLKNPSCNIVTRKGNPVRIICTDAKNEFPVVALVTKDNKEVLIDCDYNGRFSPEETANYDLFFAPEKKEHFDPHTLQPFDRVLIFVPEGLKWQCSLFSNYNAEDARFNFVCIDSFCYEFCIPYNDDTKHLVGTNDEAPEYYRYWEE